MRGVPHASPAVGRLLRRLPGASAGNVAVEFAIALPILVLLLLGTVEISRFAYLNQKLGRTTSTVADLIARAAAVSESDIDQVFVAAEEVAQPFELGERAVVIVSSITRPIGENPTIAWQRTGAGTFTATSQVGEAGEAPTFSDGFTVGEGETVIVTETYFDYRPLLGETILEPRTLYTRSHSRARKSALDTVEPG